MDRVLFFTTSTVTSNTTMQHGGPWASGLTTRQQATSKYYVDEPVQVQYGVAHIDVATADDRPSFSKQGVCVCVCRFFFFFLLLSLSLKRLVAPFTHLFQVVRYVDLTADKLLWLIDISALSGP